MKFLSYYWGNRKWFLIFSIVACTSFGLYWYFAEMTQALLMYAVFGILNILVFAIDFAQWKKKTK